MSALQVLCSPVWSPCWAPQQCLLLNYQYQSQPLSCSAIHLESCSHDCGSISPWTCLSLKWQVNIYQDNYLTTIANKSCEVTVFAGTGTASCTFSSTKTHSSVTQHQICHLILMWFFNGISQLIEKMSWETVDWESLVGFSNTCKGFWQVIIWLALTPRFIMNCTNAEPAPIPWVFKVLKKAFLTGFLSTLSILDRQISHCFEIQRHNFN